MTSITPSSCNISCSHNFSAIPQDLDHDSASQLFDCFDIANDPSPCRAQEYCYAQSEEQYNHKSLDIPPRVDLSLYSPVDTMKLRLEYGRMLYDNGYKILSYQDGDSHSQLYSGMDT